LDWLIWIDFYGIEPEKFVGPATEYWQWVYLRFMSNGKNGFWNGMDRGGFEMGSQALEWAKYRGGISV